MAHASSFDRKRRTIGLFGAPICAILIFLTPIPDLSLAAHKLLSLMVLIALWWITEPLPLPVTALLGPTLAVVIGIVPASTAFSAFANPLIFLFMGGFILATAMMHHHLDKRFAFWLLSRRWVGSNPKRILLAMGLATALCSGWVSNTATTAMMFPISLGLLGAIKEMFAAQGKHLDLHHTKYATGIMLMTAYAASIGGSLTPIGASPNIIVLGFLSEMSHMYVSFFDWMVWGAISSVLYFIIAYAVIVRMYPLEVTEITGANEFIAARRKGLGKWTRAQKNTLIAFSIAIILWITPGIMSLILDPGNPTIKLYNRLFPESVAALVGALVLFILPVDFKERQFTLSWKEAAKGIEWGTLLLFGGGLAMGTMMYATGLSAWFGSLIIDALGGNPSEVSLIAVFAVMSLVMSELTSHTAATNMVGPLGITAAMAAGFNPVPIAVAIALASSLGFMLPVSTPPNAIVYASGYIPITTMIKTGVYIDIIGIAFVTIPLAIYVVKWVIL